MNNKSVCILALLISLVSHAQTGTWSGKLDVQGNSLSLVFHLDGDSPTMDSPDQGVKGIPVQVESVSGMIKVRIPSLGAVYEGVNLFNMITGTFTQANISLPLTLVPGEVRPLRPQTPEGPYPYTVEEVSFRSGDIILNGSLVLPEGWTHETPALLLVTGSGIQNRDEEIFGHKPFAVIADAFARAGIATLRYDDRGFGVTGTDSSSWTVEDFRKDASSGMRVLRERFDKAGVLGHSEGGTIALMLAADQEADFIISMAGMVISGAETLVEQNRTTLLSMGLPESVVSRYCTLLEKTFEVKVKGGIMPDADNYDLPDELKRNYMAVSAQTDVPYIRHFINLDVRCDLGKISCPVLALNGTKDIQVDYRLNLNALRDGLSSDLNARIEEAEGLNHLFQHCTTGAVSEYRTIEETISEDVLKLMIQWISGLQLTI